jgi:signal transduction histidine kinase
VLIQIETRRALLAENEPQRLRWRSLSRQARLNRETGLVHSDQHDNGLKRVRIQAGTAQLHANAALGRHISKMEDRLGHDPVLVADLDANFHAAVTEILTVAAVSALVAAVVVSFFITGRIVSPVSAMKWASERIAAGDYRQRVPVMQEDKLGALAHSFNDMAQTLEETEQRRVELLGDVAHELRTPLSAIKGVMEGLVDGVLQAEPSTYVEVQREVARLQRLVQDLQELSRAEAGQVPLELAVTALDGLIRTTADRLRPQFEDKRVSLSVDLPRRLPQVRVDTHRMTQVLLNLLGNALQYTPSGGQVTIRAWSEGRQAFVAVQDTGIGLAAEHLPHVFERFYRVDKSRARSGGGSGIGLTIAKHLVEAQGGRIWATSPGPGQGSTFSVGLPVSSRAL